MSKSPRKEKKRRSTPKNNRERRDVVSKSAFRSTYRFEKEEVAISFGYGVRKKNKNFVTNLQKRACEFAENYSRSPLTNWQIMCYIVEMYALVHFAKLEDLLRSGDLANDLPDFKDSCMELLSYALELRQSRQKASVRDRAFAYRTITFRKHLWNFCGCKDSNS